MTTDTHNKKPNLKDLFQGVLDDVIGKEEFLAAFQSVVDSHTAFKDQTNKDLAALAQTLTDYAQEIKSTTESDVGTHKQTLDTTVSQHIDAVQAAIARLDEKLATVRNGDNADPEQVITEVLNRLVLPEQKAQLIDYDAVLAYIESLQGEERVALDAIRGLPEALQELKDAIEKRPYGSTGIHGPLWGLADVNVTGLAQNQSIKWDGVQWVPFTPSGSAGTPVYEEEVAFTGATGTLAHTPTAGTLRLYRGGARQILNSDYTLVTATITLSVAAASGEVFVAEYLY